MPMKMNWSLNDEGRMVASWVSTNETGILNDMPVGGTRYEPDLVPACMQVTTAPPAPVLHMAEIPRDLVRQRRPIQRRVWRLI